MKLSDQQLRWICDNFIFLRVVQHRLPPPLPHSILSGFRSLVPTYILVGGNSVVQWEWNVLSKKSKEWPGQVSNVDLLTWSPSCWQTVLLVSIFKTVSINGSKPGINNHVYNVIIWRKVVLRGIDISKSD